jgi:hypothetical protein
MLGVVIKINLFNITAKIEITHHPIGPLKYKGTGTSNHISRDPNKNILANDKIFTSLP